MYVFIFDLKYFNSSVDQITEKRCLILLNTVLLCYTQFLLQTSYIHFIYTANSTLICSIESVLQSNIGLIKSEFYFFLIKG
jgi:hypothetical protein